MEKIPTAKEVIRAEFVTGEFDEIMHTLNTSIESDIEAAMIKFASFHVEAYRNKIHRNALIIDNKGAKALVHGLKDFDGNMRSFAIDKHSITNCYPLSNIK
jgi:hypothetical protein